MSFEWRELIDLARVLPTLSGPNISNEAVQRTVVGRAYYAAFGHARTRAQAEGFVGLESAEDHVRLRDHFGRTGRGDVARLLNKLRQWRNQADYQNEPGNLAMMVKESVAEAQRVINRLG